ncbi:MAG: T9SS type A sorting domain-containing protein, partial [Cyclobacteriaceae bacterium]
APDGLLALLVNDTDVQLTWNDNSLNEHVFLLERSIDTQTNFENLTLTESSVTEFFDTGLKGGHSYYYRLSAFNDYGYSSSVITQTSIVTGLAKRETHFSFSPNPVSSHLNITTDTTPISIVVMNQLGQALVNLITHQSEIEIDFSSLPSGVYILKFASNSRTESRLIIKK